MEKSISNFYSDVQPIVEGIYEYRELLNSEDMSNKIKSIRRRFDVSFGGMNTSKNKLMTDRIDSVRQPQELKKQELKKLSISLGSTILNNLDRGIYGNGEDLGENKTLIKNRIAKNLLNGDFTAIDFVVNSMKNPVSYVIPEKEPSNPYGNN